MAYSSSGGAWWEWIGEYSVSKRIVRLEELPSSSGDYGNIVRQDIAPPTKIRRFRAHGLTFAQMEALTAAVSERGAVIEIVDKNEKTHTGTPVSVTAPDLEGLTLYDADVQMEVD